MKIEFNTGHNIQGGDKLSEPLIALISEKLNRFSDQITRIEVHLSDEDGDKDSLDDIKCVLEARLKGLHPVAVTNRGNTHEDTVEGAIEKMKTSLNTILGRLGNHRDGLT